MVEYSYDEAIALLENNFKIATKNLQNINDDIAFLKDQITTTEVNQARVHNHGVRLRAEKVKK
jgi:prefoldin subunit 5